MVPFKSGKTSNTHKPNSNQDLISNLPEIAIDKILKRLPIKIVAQMSILSKKWRDIWLSLKYLIFDQFFWNELKDDESDSEESEVSRCNCIISNILFHHVGPVHQFYLDVSYDQNYGELYVNGWVSLLSKVGVKKIALLKHTHQYETIPPSIFNCKDLVKLELKRFILNHTPSQFKGFAYLQCLKLHFFQFKNDLFRSLLAECPQLRRLTVLNLEGWATGINSLVIDAPILEHLTIQGCFQTIVFKNICHLRFVSLYLDPLIHVAKAKGVEHSIEMLASSCQLRDFHCGGRMCKYFGAGSIAKSPILKFLHRLRLTDVNLSDFNEFCFTLGMLQCCPFIRDLYISVNPNKRDIEHEFDYDKNFELKHLVEVEIIDLTGSRPQLKLIEYLFCAASNLEKLAITCCYNLDLKSELKVTQDLSALPRASPKAKLVCLK